jgi:hypothetical protein
MYPCNARGNSRYAGVPRLALLLGATALVVAAQSVSAGVEMGAGVDAQVDKKETPVLTLGYLTDQRYPWEFSIGRFAEHDRPDGFEIAPVTYYVCAARRLTWNHWFVSGGLAYNTSNDPVLSGHIQAQTALGFAFDHWTFSIRHMSNGSTSGDNHGETFALLQYGM